MFFFCWVYKLWKSGRRKFSHKHDNFASNTGGPAEKPGPDAQSRRPLNKRQMYTHSASAANAATTRLSGVCIVRRSDRNSPSYSKWVKRNRDTPALSCPRYHTLPLRSTGRIQQLQLPYDTDMSTVNWLLCLLMYTTYSVMSLFYCCYVN